MTGVQTCALPICEKCNKGFLTKYHLTRHLKICKGPKTGRGAAHEEEGEEEEEDDEDEEEEERSSRGPDEREECGIRMAGYPIHPRELKTVRTLLKLETNSIRLLRNMQQTIAVGYREKARTT